MAYVKLVDRLECGPFLCLSIFFCHWQNPMIEPKHVQWKFNTVFLVFWIKKNHVWTEMSLQYTDFDHIYLIAKTRERERESCLCFLMNFARGFEYYSRLPLAKYYKNVIKMTQLKGTKIEMLWHKAWAECLTAISSVCGFAYAIIALTRLPVFHILSRWYT